MIVSEVSAEEYRRIFPHPAVAYNSVAFTELNASKAERIVRVTIGEEGSSPILGITFGEKGGEMRAPFSAPFACFDANRSHGAALMVEAAVALRRNFGGAKITLPPPFYDGSKALLALTSAGSSIEHIDWNYHLDLSRPIAENFSSAARNKLRQAQKSELRLEASSAERAYQVIRLNRRNRGYSLAMTLEEVLATTAKKGPICGDFFVLTDGKADAAAAVVFYVSPGIAQVIYWGDVPYSCCRQPMNLLALLLAEHYTAAGFHILDIGPASSNGVPSAGLCDFKESIGCIATIKPTLTL